MNFFTRLRVQFRQWRRRRAAENQKGILREFVYLDEVSVYSLIASRLGPIAAEFTETETTSLQGEIGSSIGAGAGVAKVDVNSHVLNSQSRGSQVLRKSIVQATFKDLYELELDSLAIRPLLGDLSSPKINSIDDLIAATRTSAGDCWIVDPNKLARGQLFELEVQLEADTIFRVSAVASTILEILEEDAETFGLDPTSDLIQMKSVGRILEKLLVGLVPIRGQVLDYCIVELEGQKWIVHRKLLNELPSTNLLPIHPLFVVGVAEQALFWKDIRRILFSKAHYRILCRMAQNGIQTSWTPVKLADVLESVMPGFAGQINLAGSDAFTAITDSGKFKQGTELKQQLMHDALLSYAELLVDHFHIKLTPQHLDQIELISAHHCVSFGNQKVRREAFESIATYLIDNFNIKRDPLIFAQYRASALVDAGLDFSGNPIPLATSRNGISPTSSDEYFLDSEFVAIYW